MTQRYLLAAEADQIQDFIFRASHLREVVGASQLLTRFGDRKTGVVPHLGVKDADLVVSGGGSFRILFDTAEDAMRIGEQLAEAYHRVTGGTLKVIAAPEPVDVAKDADFRRAGEAVHVKLRQAKRTAQGYLTNAQFPYAAFCASCGIGLAAMHEPRHEQDEEAQYLCAACRARGAERTEKSLGAFLKPFVQAVIDKESALDPYIWPGKEKGRGGMEDIDPTADVAQFDSRNYIAYLLADGNNMGQVFEQCNRVQMRELSKGLTLALRDSLARTTKMLKRTQPEIKTDFIPTLPLIMGGDDLFALIPAPWALDFAHHFCLEFEEQMTNLVNNLKLPKRKKLPPRITTGAVVVICKANYPFSLAHEIGETRLRAAKSLAKRLAREPREVIHSVVDFEIILGSQAEVPADMRKYRAMLRPYWVTKADVPAGWGIKLDTLIDWRMALHALPQKRRAQFRALYYPSALPGNAQQRQNWKLKRDALLQRLKRSEEIAKRVEEALTALGGDWYRSQRAGELIWHGHGLPDLLEAWDFAYRLDRPRRDYEEI
jgi:hypothetical protein